MLKTFKLQRKDDNDWVDWIDYFLMEDATIDLAFRQNNYPQIKWRIQTIETENEE